MSRRMFWLNVALNVVSFVFWATEAHAGPVATIVVQALIHIGVSVSTALAVAHFVAFVVLPNVAIAAATRLMSGSRNQSLPERQASVITLQLGEAPREAIFGEAATSGQLLDAFNYGGTYGTDWEMLAIAVADHRCQSLEGFYIGDTYYPFSGDGYQPGFNNQLIVNWHDGQFTQAADGLLIANSGGRWTSNDKLSGIAYVVVAYQADAPNAATPQWPQGRPAFLWRVKGARLYDPRKDSTVAGGSGSHRWATPSTWEWSDNAYLARYAYTRGIYAGDQVADPTQLLIGRGLSAEQAPPERVAAYANLCDELVTLKAGGTEKRYRVNGLVRADESFITVEQMFAEAMAGVIVQRDGAVEIEPGAAKAAVATFTDADLLVGKPIRVEQFLSDADRVNTITPRYIEPEQAWRDHAAPVRRSTADITADGGPREKTLSLPLVTSHTQAQRAAEIERRLCRLERRAALTLGPRFAYLEDGDWIAWQSDRYFAGATVTFRIEAAALDEGYRSVLMLREIASSCYSWTAASDEGTPQAAPVDEPGSLTALALSGVSIVALSITGDSGLVTPAIKATWTTPLDAAITGVRIEVRKAGSTDFATDVQLDPGAGKLVTTNGVVALTGMEARLIPVSTFGRRCTPTAWTAVTTGAIDAGGADIPSANLWRKQDYSPSGAAAAITPTFGVAKWGFRFTGSSAGAVTSTRGGFGLNVSPDFARYSFLCQARLSSGTGSATVRIGVRTPGGAAITGIPDKVVTVSAAAARVVWENIKTTDANFATAVFKVFTNAGDLTSAQAVEVTDFDLVYGDTAPLGYAPSPDDPQGLALFGFTGALDATKNRIFYQSSDPTGSNTVVDGDVWIDTSVSTMATFKSRVSGSWQASSTIGGAFGTNLYQTPGGSVATLSAFLTSLGVAASVAGQTSWATEATLTPAIVSGKLVYFDVDGRQYDYRGLLFGYSVSGVAGRGVDPLTSGVGTISVASHTIYLPQMSGLATLSIPSHTFTGLLNDHDYVVFYRPQYGDWFPIQAENAPAYYTSRDGYLWLGNIRTPTSGGSYVAPTTAFSSTGSYDEFLCVSVAAWLPSGRQVVEAAVGEALTLMTPDGEALIAGAIERIDFGEAALVALRTRLGAELTVSHSAPLMTRKGPGYLPRAVRASLAEPGLAVPVVIGGELVWDELVSAEPAGRGPVAKISAGGAIYASADNPAGPFLLHHNMYSKSWA